MRRMNLRRWGWVVTAWALAVGLGVTAVAALPGRVVRAASVSGSTTIVSDTEPLTPAIYLPIAAKEISMVEWRGVWVSRYDWTRMGVTPTVTDIQRVVDQAAGAGFNAIFFQVRAAGDAYYTPGLEPWAARMTGSSGWTLGQNPGWDPLTEMISRAHRAGVQVHAWINVYPAWQAPLSSTYGLLTPTLGITPAHPLNLWTYIDNGGYGLGYRWRVYDRPVANGYMPIQWNQYLWASPAVPAVREHIAAVAGDLVSRYEIDGLHLDNVRYPGPGYSWDPFTLAAYEADPLSATMTITNWRPAFQREQVTQLVAQIATQTHATRPTATVSAAVWGVYRNWWGWPATSQGYVDYYQDSQRWVLSGTLDALAPMIYAGNVITDLEKWTLAAQDFQDHAGSGKIMPGIGVVFSSEGCVPFDQLAARVETARRLQTAGQAFFSLGGLVDCGYLDDLKAGPYAVPARWRP